MGWTSLRGDRAVQTGAWVTCTWLSLRRDGGRLGGGLVSLLYDTRLELTRSR